MCRTRHFRSKGQCATEIQLLNTPLDRRCCRGRQAMTPLWCSSINTLWFPQKNCRVHVRGRGWQRQRYLPPRLRGDMATPTAIALDSSFNLLLISRILVGTNGNGRHHVIIALVIARRGETTHSGVDVNNTHLSMINPLNQPCQLDFQRHAVHWVHDVVIKWKRFPRYWPFVRGFHRSPVDSPHKGQ